MPLDYIFASSDITSKVKKLFTDKMYEVNQSMHQEEIYSEKFLKQVIILVTFFFATMILYYAF